jgi:hypothetical protein
LANFLTNPNQVFALCLPSTSWTFVLLRIQSAVPLRGVSTKLLLDFKVAKWAKPKCKLLNLRGNHLISTLAAFVFVPSVFGGNIPPAEFGMVSERKWPNF